MNKVILASALIITRQSQPSFEVLMVQRKSRQSFGGSWAFPGGACEPQDCSKTHGEIIVGQDYEISGLGPYPTLNSHNLMLTAIREAYEEVGIIPASQPSALSKGSSEELDFYEY